MNTWCGIGRLGKDPEVRYSQGENPTAVARFSIAIDRWDGRQNVTDWFDITAFGKTAETIERYLAKGRRVGVTGHLQRNTYQNRDGQTVTVTQIIADRIDFCDSVSDGGQGAAPARQAQGGQYQQQAQGGQYQQTGQRSQGRPAGQRQAYQQPPRDDGFVNVPDGIDEELPFR